MLPSQTLRESKYCTKSTVQLNLPNPLSWGIGAQQFVLPQPLTVRRILLPAEPSSFVFVEQRLLFCYICTCLLCCIFPEWRHAVEFGETIGGTFVGGNSRMCTISQRARYTRKGVIAEKSCAMQDDTWRIHLLFGGKGGGVDLSLVRDRGTKSFPQKPGT